MPKYSWMPARRLSLIPIIAVLGLGVSAAWAQSSANAGDTDAGAWAQNLFNPKPLEDDVVLPMPCNGSMVFRKILVPLPQPLDDLPITLGSSDQEWGVLESAYDVHIAGSFTEPGGDSGRYYLLGKYEVSQLQYDAVMSDTCPPTSAKMRLPKTNLSWFEGVAFADRYSQWLHANAADQLPNEDGMSGFVRLPTEVEWSYAARGGVAVSPSEFQDFRFPMPEGLSKYAWFAGPQSSNGSMRFTGLLEPNPLGLHDILGNADEMIFESFQLRTHGRAHGQAGGFIVKGGNFLTPQSDIRTSWRVEQPYYRQGAQNRLPTTGLRLSLVAPATESGERLKLLQQQWLARGASRDQAGEDAAARLEKLAAGTTDAAIQQELNRARDELRISNQSQQEQRERAIRSSLQFGSFLCTQMNQIGRHLERGKDFLKVSCDPNNPRSGEEACKNIRNSLDQTQISLDTVSGLYSDSIVELGSIYTPSDINDQAKVVKQTLLERRATTLDRYVDAYVNDLTAYISERTIKRSDWLKGCIAVTQ